MLTLLLTRRGRDAGMDDAKVEKCLAYLRQADAILLDARELTLAAHLSLVIELLARRLERR